MSCPSLKEFPRVQLSPWAGKGVSGQQGTWVLLKIIKWYRKGVVSKTAPRDSMHCHTVTPSAQNWFMLGHYQFHPTGCGLEFTAMHIFTNIFWLEKSNVHFSSLSSASLQANPIYTLFQFSADVFPQFCSFVKEEGKDQLLEDAVI